MVIMFTCKLSMVKVDERGERVMMYITMLIGWGVFIWEMFNQNLLGMLIGILIIYAPIGYFDIKKFLLERRLNRLKREYEALKKAKENEYHNEEN